MAIIRLDNEERRSAIVEAAMPLFARKGFAGTTTKEIAEAARVSEALVFKHFPSKAALYQEILRVGCLGDPALERVSELEPSTASLVHMIRFMIRHLVLTSELDTRHRLMVNGYLDDGEYCQLVFESIFARVFPKFAECLEAARAAGDLAPTGVALENRFWFAQHVAVMLAYVRLPPRAVVPYRGDTEAVVAEAAAFILRGLGLKDEAIARHCAADAPSECQETQDREASRA
jgi:TetR/AcrR family transcriptional regulator, transcriptional repressor of aconitase